MNSASIGFFCFNFPMSFQFYLPVSFRSIAMGACSLLFVASAPFLTSCYFSASSLFCFLPPFLLPTFHHWFLFCSLAIFRALFSQPPYLLPSHIYSCVLFHSVLFALLAFSSILGAGCVLFFLLRPPYVLLSWLCLLPPHLCSLPAFLQPRPLLAFVFPSVVRAGCIPHFFLILYFAPAWRFSILFHCPRHSF